MRFSLALVGACCLALLGCAAAGGSSNNNLWGLVGRWQGVCVTKGYRGDCVEDIISFPYYVEYSWDSYYNKPKMQYRQDAITINTWNSHHEYDLHSYSDKGWVNVNQNYDGFCVDVNYDHDSKRSYRVKLKHEGELDVLIEEGEYDQHQEHSGIWGKCPAKSWKSLKCDSYTYSYRCYLVRTSKWSWAW